MDKKNNKFRNFLDINQLTSEEMSLILKESKRLKEEHYSGMDREVLSGKQVALIFEKPSTRTRVSFEVGVNQLGGKSVILTSSDSQLGRGEPIVDTAKVLTRYVDMIMIRTFKHETLKDMAEFANIPVINGLTDFSHPCQVLTDILTIEEKLGTIQGKTVSWFGDCNNMANSWMHAAEVLDFKLKLCCPEELAPSTVGSDNISVVFDTEKAARGADVITTDTWVSMGDTDGEYKNNILRNYKVTKQIMDLANDDAIFLHCLPAHRGEEVEESVIDGPRSVIYDEAENRLHVQKAIMLWCFCEI